MSSVAAFPRRLCQLAAKGSYAFIALTAVVILAGCTTAPTGAAAHHVAAGLQVVHMDPASVSSAAEALAGAHEGDFTLTGIGESMRPVYVPGTVVVVHPTSFFMLRTGDAVVYVNHRGHDVAHVLVEELSVGWTSQGLNNAEPDEDLVTTRNLVGIVRCAFVPDTAKAPAASVASLAAATARSNRVALLR